MKRETKRRWDAKSVSFESKDEEGKQENNIRVVTKRHEKHFDEGGMNAW